MTEWMISLALVESGAAALMVALWLVQRARKDASLVDAGWAGGIGAAAIWLLAQGGGDPSRRVAIGVLIGLWSLRLTVHLLRDRVLGKSEDGRYRMLRERWGTRAQPWFFLFFQFQALLVTVFAAPFVLLANDARAFGTPCDWFGVGVWLAALAGELVADRQLAGFRADPANHGRTCRAGLWRYSRHPNYFFEWLHWWSYVALAAGGAHVWTMLLVPGLLLFLLLKVTGIPYTEARALASRGDDYRAYQRTTSAFIPWFPKKDPP